MSRASSYLWCCINTIFKFFLKSRFLWNAEHCHHHHQDVGSVWTRKRKIQMQLFLETHRLRTQEARRRPHFKNHFLFVHFSNATIVDGNLRFLTWIEGSVQRAVRRRITFFNRHLLIRIEIGFYFALLQTIGSSSLGINFSPQKTWWPRAGCYRSRCVQVKLEALGIFSALRFWCSSFDGLFLMNAQMFGAN